MRKQNELLGSRATVREHYALLPLEGIPYSRLPEWPEAEIRVLAAPALGANFAQYLIDLNPGNTGSHDADGAVEHFIFVLQGEAELAIGRERSTAGFRSDSDEAGAAGSAEQSRRHKLTTGGYALVPPSRSYDLRATAATSLLLLRKWYEPAAGIDEFEPLVGNEQDVPGEVYMGDEGAHLQTLIPDEFAYDMAMNIFTFEVGHSLPVTETHVMEHGLYVLQGKGLYYLDDEWMEVEKSDFIWMGPFCPQSYYATGPEATRYIYYKNVNREIPL